jgi:hypothetical protein
MKEKHVYITMEGGLIQNIEVTEDLKGVTATVVDFDQEDETPDLCNGTPCYVAEWENVPVAREEDYKIELGVPCDE